MNGEKEKTEAEEALQLSEQKFAMAFANNPAAIALSRLEDGLFLDVNDTWVALTGYSREEAVGHSARKMNIWPTPEDAARFVRELREKGVLRGWEQAFRKKSGETYIVQLSAQLLTVQGESVILSSLVDITERKRVEEALRQSREDLDRAQAVGQIGSWRLDTRNNVLTWSDENHRIFGVPKGAPLTYETFLATIHPDDREYVDRQWKAGLRGEPYDIEHRIVADGKTKWVREKAYLEFNVEGALLGGFGITQDITKHKVAEDRARRAAAELEAANADLEVSRREALELMEEALAVRKQVESLARFPQENPNPVVRVSVDGRVLYANPAAAENAEWTSENGRILAPLLHTLVERAVAERSPMEQDITLGERTYAVAVALFPEEGYCNLYGRDVTAHTLVERDLRKVNRALNALSHSSQALMRVTEDEEEPYLNEACRIVVQDCGYAMVWIGFAEDDDSKSIRPAACAGFEEGYLATLNATWADTERGRGPTGTAIRTGQVCRCLDMLTDPRFKPWRKDAIQRGYASSIALPLMAGGKAFGALTIYSREPIGFVEEEMKLLTDLAADFAHGIMAFRSRAARERAEKAVHESEERYRALFNTMTEGFARHEIICDRDGRPCDYRFLDINPAFERLTGLKRENVVGKSVREIMPGTESVWIERYGRVALTGVPDHFDHFSGELGRHYRVVAFRNAPGCFAVIFNDVTELKAMQQREKEDAIRLAWGQSAIDTVNAMHEGVVLLEMDGTIASVNPAVESLTGLTGGEMIGRKLATFLPQFLSGVETGTAMRWMRLLRDGEVPVVSPLVLRRADGDAVHVLPNISMMDAPEGGRRVVVLTLKDVTDLHKTSQRLRELAERLAAADEEDRWRISRYIHDTIIQNLSLSYIRLGAMEKPLNEAKLDGEIDRLRQVRDLIDHACSECRMVMSDLTPALLYELGLIPALHDLAHRLEAKHGTRITVEDDGQERDLSPPLRGFLFQSVRELIMNALKHADPREIHVALRDGEEGLTVSVADDGKGFAPATAKVQRDHHGGFGLFNIRQRLEGLGGQLHIESAPGKGTTARITVPLEEEVGR